MQVKEAPGQMTRMMRNPDLQTKGREEIIFSCPQGGNAIADLSSLPLAPLKHALASVVAILQTNHPGFFERMEGYYETRFLIDPVDVPMVFLFRTHPENPSITPCWNAQDIDFDVKISGHLSDLIDLFEGRVDGDALFFSRAISIEGDTSATLALRNSIDSEEIELISEIAARFGPFGAPLRLAGEKAPALIGRTYDFVERIRASMRKTNHAET